LLFFFSLGHNDLGRLIPLLLTTLTGPVALFAAVTTDFIVTRGAFAVASHALLAASFSFAARLPAIAVAIGHAVVGARAGTVAHLPARQPLLLREEQTAITIFGGRRLLPLLHSAEMTNCLLN
jgi:hypothetical protein